MNERQNQTTDPAAFIGQYFIALSPHMFRTGKPARIEGIVTIRGRPCFWVRYQDGVEDQTPIANEDFAGSVGLGVFYKIVKEVPNEF
jgi:hypothetical protein